jgi:peptide/nickel transport system permease protein
VVSRFLLRRLAAVVGTLLVSSFVVFSGLYLAPGSPIAFLLGNRQESPAAVAAVEAQFHLNKPFFDRYWLWLTGVLHGSFGTSLTLHTSVGHLLGPRIGTSLFLIVYASLIITIFGVGLGVLAALRGGIVDTVLIVATTVGMAIPSFVAAIVLIAVFAVDLNWFPVFGSGSGFTGHLYHLTMPAVALAIASTAYVLRVTRTAVRAEAAREHVQTAISRGIPFRLVVTRHILRNGEGPIVTVGALSMISLIAGTVVVENAFGLNGLGSLLISSVQNHDFAVVQAICLIFVALVVVVSTLVDVAYFAIDPRIRYGAEA